MAERAALAILAILLTRFTAVGQETSYGPGYQTVLANNPAFSGSEGDGILRLSYMNFYPGNNFKLESVFMSYDSYIEAIHGGAGIFISDDYMGGIINDLRGGLSYAYHLQANKNLFINAGLTASCYYRGFNLSNMILPDQIDPVNGVVSSSGDLITGRGRAVFDIGTGLMVISERYIAALALNHLTAPDLSGTGIEADRIARKLVLNLAGKFDLRKDLQIAARPIILVEYQGRDLTGGLGTTVENNTLSLSAILLSNRSKDIDLQAGCSFKIGKLLFFYNYRFNISSNNRLLPVSLMHQTGLALSLNSVDKRKAIKTINFPKL